MAVAGGELEDAGFVIVEKRAGRERLRRMRGRNVCKTCMAG